MILHFLSKSLKIILIPKEKKNFDNYLMYWALQG